MGSKANGALMRATPLAVWGHKLPQHDLVEAVMSDAQLTHPNKTCLVRLTLQPRSIILQVADVYTIECMRPGSKTCSAFPWSQVHVA